MKINQHILFFFSNAIGDAFMVLPTIRAFKENYQKVSIICDSNYYFLFQEIDFECVFFLYQIENVIYSNISITTISEIQKKHFDFFISLSSYHNETIEKILKNVNFKVKIGYTGSIYDYEIADPYCKTNMFDVYFKSFQYFNKEALIIDYSDKIIPKNQILDSNNFKNEFKIITVHTDTKPEKTWKSYNFFNLISKIINEYEDVLIVIIGIPKINFSSISDRIIQFDTPNFFVSWEMLNMSDFFIGLDSCFMHLADINNIPSITLFGETNEAEWGYRFNENGKIIKAKNGLLQNISVNSIFKKLSIKMEQISSN